MIGMAVRIFYVDESYDNEKFCLSALSIRHSSWMDCFNRIREHRKQLKRTHGIFMRKEIHATDLVRGRGRISDRVIPKWTRARIFHSLLQLMSELPDAYLFNICLKQAGLADAQMRAWDRLTNRIERTLKHSEEVELPLRTRLGQNLTVAQGISAEDAAKISVRLGQYRSRGIIIADEGRESEITTALRKMHVHNMIPSAFGHWEPGVRAINITTDRIIEDPFFKASHRSYFLQLADCAAFALLKREVTPTELSKKYGLHKMFDETLAQICFRKAAANDPLGIVRA
jgi:hypothetical protein